MRKILQELLALSGICFFPPESMMDYIKNTIKLFFALGQGSVMFFYSLFMPAVKREEKECHLAIVAIAKNESEYIREWCAYHKAIGIDRIYLYDNDSNDNMLSEIDDFIESGFVVCNSIHGKKKQLPSYNHALEHYGKGCSLMAFIDCDEYLVPLTAAPIAQTIKDAFSCSKRCGGIGINWCMYGSSGYTGKPEGLCIENFTYRAKCPGGRAVEHIKTVVDPECVREFSGNPHSPKYRSGYCGYDFEGSPIIGPFNWIKEYSAVKVNHYFTKSLPQYIKRRSLGTADSDICRPLKDFYDHNQNDIYDPIPEELIEKTKQLMQHNKSIMDT